MNFRDFLLQPLYFIGYPQKRIFFIYLISSLLIGFLALKIRSKQDSYSIFQTLFSKKIWLHPSAILDYKLFLFNIFLKSLIFYLIIVSSYDIAKIQMIFLQKLFPKFTPLEWKPTYIALFYTTISFLILDFFRFLQHFLMHRLSWLWKFHKIHHSARVLTPMTLYRTHPIESLISGLRQIVILGGIYGIFVFLFGGNVSGYAIIGINLIDFLFNLVGSNLRHSHIWISFGFLNHIFISPALHQIHHSREKNILTKILALY